MSKSTFKFVFVTWFFMVVVQLSIVAAIIYVAVHFIQKYW